MVRNTRKRKVPVVAPIDEEKENESESAVTAASATAFNNGPMYKIMSHVQTSEALHKKYIKEMQQLYLQMHHEAFLLTFIRVIKSAMECDESNEYALTSLQFCSKFIASYNEDDTHPILIGIFDWISQTISNNPHIRFRLCQFVNLILTALGAEAALDDDICDKILEYMIDRLRDVSPSVRVQAIVAMQRLQAPENPNDPVLRAYQFHLCSDPSPRVRQAVITSMGRNYITVPYILDRLWDIDEKVRRHTYLHMSSYPVRSYKVSQRLTLLEQGLNDRAESVRKIVTKVMLRQWLESYQKDIIGLVSALKLDANDGEIERFRKVAKQMLKEIFKLEECEPIIALLPLDYEGDFPRCVLYENLSVEIALYWQCLSEFFQEQGADEFDQILPELSVFCAYVENFCKQQNPDEDKFQRLEFQNKLLALLEILYKYDLGDEIGRENFQKLIAHLLRNVSLDDKNIEIVVRCAENLMSDQNTRLQFLTGIVQDLCQLNKEHNNLWNDRNLINEALANCVDPALNLKLSELKVKILDLEEQEMVFLQHKNFVRAQEVTDEKNAATEEYTNLLKPLLSQPLVIKKVKNENILTGLQIIFHMVVSEKVRSLSPQVYKLYNDFICRHIASAQIPTRDWALKCSTAYSMHYEPIAKELFDELYQQFFKHHNARIWETSVKCVFEIMDMYGVERFSTQEQPCSSKRSGRTLYNTLGSLDTDDETQVSVDGQSVGVIHLMSHFLDTCDNVAIVSEIILGFIKLILHGFIQSSDIIEKLLIRYFNPSTDTKINQYLSIFLEEMIKHKKQSLLVPSLLPTVTAVITAPYDSPLLEIRPETITRFFIDITRQDACTGRKINLHNKIAHSFFTEMLSNTNNKDLCKLLAKEILKLEVDVRSDAKLKQELMEMSFKLLLCEFDVNTVKNITNFQGMLQGTFNPQSTTANDSDDDGDEDTLTNQNHRNTASVTTVPTLPTTNTPTPSLTSSNVLDNNDTPILHEEAESTLTSTQILNDTQEVCNPSSSTATTKKSITENNITNAGEDVGVTAADAIESSQNSTISIRTSQCTEVSATSVQIQSQVMANPSPVVITTYGRRNELGQFRLRKSLNSSQNQSESELSDHVSVPKIRIEVRIDSEKKKKTNADEQNDSQDTAPAKNSPIKNTPVKNTPVKNTPIKNTPAKKTPAKIIPSKKLGSPKATLKPIASTSGRNLRQLRGRQKSVSPTPISASEKKTNNDQISNEEETNLSDVVPESPQPTRNISMRSKLLSTRLASTRSTRAQNTSSESSTKPTTSRQTTQTNTSSITKQRVRSPRKVLYTNLQVVSSRKRRFPKTPLPKKNMSQRESSTDSTSSSSKSPQPKQARHSVDASKNVHTTPKQRNYMSNTDKQDILEVSTAITTRSSSKKNLQSENILTRHRKSLPQSKIPVKSVRSSSTSNTGASRSSSSSPLRKNATRKEPQPDGRNLRSSHQSKIPRKLFRKFK